MKIVVFALFLAAHCELTIAQYRQHYFINQAKTWIEALQYCLENYDDMSSLDGADQIVSLKTAIDVMNTYSSSATNTDDNPYYNTAAWIGLNKSSTTDNWQWSDGTVFNSNLGIHLVNYMNRCVKFQYSVLYDFSCLTQQPFFCYKWVPELILVKENKTWEDALQHCRTHYTDLASLPTYLHLIQAKHTITITETRSVWTGLRFLTGSWLWVSGKALGNLVQLPACPTSRSYCGARNQTAQSWENRDCMDKLYFVCY